jgi:hypothetical protein
MRPLLAGQGCRRGCWGGRMARRHLDLYLLAAHQAQTGSPLGPAAPISPEHGGRGHRERMRLHTHTAGLGRGSTLPLTLPLRLLSQRTGVACSDARRIEDAQAAIRFSAALRRREELPGRTAQRPSGLAGKVLPGEAALFARLARLCQGQSKLGGAHRLRLEVMAQFQARVPDPLADE